MFLTVTLNAAVDKTWRLEALQPGLLHRPTSRVTLAGGKGINVSRVLRALGAETLATGLVAGPTGEAILRLLAAEELPHQFHRLAAGDSRTCVALVHADGTPPTEINEYGPTVDGADFEGFLAVFEQHLPAASWVVLSGSLPPGLPADAYVRLLALARRAGKRVSLDSSGPELPALLPFAPDVIKPNEQEAAALLGAPVVLDQLPAALAHLQAAGPRVVALSMGRAGAAVATDSEAWWIRAPEVPVVNPVGSGDAFLAAFLAQWERGAGLAEAARWGVAAGSANAAVEGAAACSAAAIEALVPRVAPVPLAEAVSASFR
jgi:1-phosphofructokinase family hexose kinase